MTRFNWEKASKDAHYFRLIFAKDRPADGQLEFHVSPAKRALSEFKNPIGLTEDDCLGRTPAPEKRKKIAAHLLQSDQSLRDTYGLSDGTPLGDAVQKISGDSKSFRWFCFKVATADISPEENFWPLAVCLSIFFLDAFNRLIAAKGEKASCLTWEIFDRVSNYRLNPDTPVLGNSPKSPSSAEKWADRVVGSAWRPEES